MDAGHACDEVPGSGSRQDEGYVVVGDAFIPPTQCPAGRVLYDGLLVVLADEATDSIDASEKRDRGEHDLLAIVLAQEARAAEAVDFLQLVSDFRFVVALVIIGCGLRCPTVPYPRDHLPSLR